MKKKSYYLSLFLCLFLIVFVASAQAQKTPAPNRTAVPNYNTVTKAIAVISSGQGEGQGVNGTITFTKVNGGVRVVAVINGLKPGNHGFHVHEWGDCSNFTGGSAGPHFNPYNGPHAGPDTHDRHVGDLGNISVDNSGQGRYDRVDNIITLQGTNSVIGRAIVIHSNADDFTTQPDGNSGAPVACGVIGIAKP